MNTRFGLKELENEFGKLTFGRVLKAHRLGEGMSQVEMAKILKISKQSLNDLEGGRTLPSISRAADIAKKIGMMEVGFVQLALQDHLDREHLNFRISLEMPKNKTRAS